MSQPDHDPSLSGQVLLGLEPQTELFTQALDRGRLHHAWLLTGPKGLGKAAFAHRAARLLLGAKARPELGLLASSPEDRVNRLVAAQSHPDFIALDRYGEDGKIRRNISVDDARKLPEFFSKAPALAPWRVAIIDAADDLNVNAANAVLKTLEEPPPRGVLFLISHSPGRLLATIRSRCRKLPFRPWSEVELAQWLADRQGMDHKDAAHISRMAGGAPGRALELGSGSASSIDALALALLNALPGADEAMLVNLADGFRGAEGLERFNSLIERLCEHISAAIRNPDLPPSAGRDRWAQAWVRLTRLPGEVEGLNLDRADALWTALAELKSAARLSPLPQ
jgi:DNA polymerase-3 subunit delta'